jgi:small-conductance mechanosensitive channel/CRP-like cAMP-binding protein
MPSFDVEVLVDFLGLLTILGAGSMVFAMLFRRIAGKGHHPVRFGLSLLLFFTILLLLKDWLIDKHLPGIFGAWQVAIGQGVASLWWLSLAFTLNRMLERYVWRGVLLSDDQPAVPKLVTDFVAGFVYLIAIMTIIHLVFDRPITAIAATSGAVAFIFGYSAQATLGEVFAGISVNLAKPFAKGQMVSYNNEMGTVQDMNWRFVTIRSVDGNLRYIPNSRIATNEIVNFDQPERRTRRSLSIDFEHGASPGRIIAVLGEALKHCPSILQTPPPIVVFDGFADLGQRFVIRYWIPHITRFPVCANEVASAVWHASRRAGIRLAYRRSQVFTENDPDYAQRFTTTLVEPNLADVLKSTWLFAELDEGDLTIMAEAAERREFGWPERIIRQGDQGNSMFVIAMGSVEVTLTQADGSELRVAELGVGEPVGIMSLLTGEPRGANVRAKSDLLVYEIGKTAMERVFERRPAIMEKLADMIAEMQMENERKQADYARSQQEEGTQKRRLVQDLMGRIRTFFRFGQAPAAEAVTQERRII